MCVSCSRCVDVLNLTSLLRNSSADQYDFILAAISSLLLLAAECGHKVLKLHEAWEDMPDVKTHHIFNLAVPITEDNGIRRITHWQHHRKGDTHGDRNQGV